MCIPLKVPQHRDCPNSPWKSFMKEKHFSLFLFLLKRPAIKKSKNKKKGKRKQRTKKEKETEE